jgi:hypothetical protein
MGSWRRRDIELEQAGVSDENVRNELNRDIELLLSAGDSYSDAIYPWLADGTHVGRREAIQGLTESLATHAQAIGRIISYLNGS